MAQPKRTGTPVTLDTVVTVEAFLKDWLDATTYSVRPRTWHRYSEYVRLHLVPALGETPLSDLGSREIQALYADKIGNGLSPMSVLHMHSVLHRALGQAERWGLIQFNPTDLVTAPRPETLEMNALSPEEARRFLDAARGDRLEALYTLAITTGMRQGELLGLHWRDVDLDQQSVRVTGSLQYVPGKGLQISAPKTTRSRRRVLLSELAVTSLTRHRSAQHQFRDRSRQWEENDLVFPNNRGRPIYATNLVSRSFGRLLDTANVRRVRFHDLRHTAATLLLGEGVHPKVVSEMLGHSKTGITLDTYSHATPTMQLQAAKAFDRILR